MKETIFSIQEEMDEAAKGMSDAQIQKLCLLQTTEGAGRSGSREHYLILFDGEKCLEHMAEYQAAIGDTKKVIQELNNLALRAYEKFKDYFVKYIRLSPKSFNVLTFDKRLQRLLDLLENSEENSDNEEADYFFQDIPEARNWDPSEVEAFIKEHESIMSKLGTKRANLLRQGLDAKGYFPRAFTFSMFGFIKILNGSCPEKDTFTISLAAAEKGWGPMMYDLALSLVHPGFLASDRHDVSGYAKKVWDFYFQHRQDVEHVLMDSIHNGMCNVPGIRQVDLENYMDAKRHYFSLRLKLKNNNSPQLLVAIRQAEKEYDILLNKYYKLVNDNPLAYKYRIKTPIVEQAGLESNTDEFLARLNTNYGLEISKRNLMSAGESYFEKKYRLVP